MIYTAYSNISSIIRVLYNRINHLIYTESDYILQNVERQIDKPLICSIITHISAPFNYASYIDENIFLGNAYNAADFSYMEFLEIDIVINVSKELSNYFEGNSKIEYYKLEIHDVNGEDMSIIFDKFLKIINSNLDKKILIHCFMGHSRSAILVLLYLIKIKKMNKEDAIEFLVNKRTEVNINNTFINNLDTYLNN